MFCIFISLCENLREPRPPKYSAHLGLCLAFFLLVLLHRGGRSTWQLSTTLAKTSSITPSRAPTTSDTPTVYDLSTSSPPLKKPARSESELFVVGELTSNKHAVGGNGRRFWLDRRANHKAFRKEVRRLAHELEGHQSLHLSMGSYRDKYYPPESWIRYSRRSWFNI